MQMWCDVRVTFDRSAPWRLYQRKPHGNPKEKPHERPLTIVSTQDKMAASIGRSHDMQMRCDVICHVTALDQSEPSLLGDKMAASIGKSPDMPMRCDVIG